MQENKATVQSDAPDRLGSKYFLACLGPGFIIAATSVGAGTITSATNAGANYGYNLIWWLVVIMAFQMAYSLAMRRFTIVTGKPIMVGVRDTYGPVWAGLAGVFAFVGQCVYGIGNFMAAGMGLNILFPGLDIKVGGLISLALCALLLFMKSLYKKTETLMKVLVGTMVLIFLVALIMGGGPGAETNTRILPSVPAGSMALMLSLLGTTASLGTCAWGSSLAKEKGYTTEDIRRGGARIDVLVSSTCIGIITLFVMIVGANLLPGQPITTGLQLSSALGELIGGFIRPVFGIGFFAAAVSSLMMAPKLGINLLLQAFRKDTGFENRRENVIAILMLVFGAIIAWIYGGAPAQLLTLAQIGGVINTPILGILTIILVSSKKHMGEFKVNTANTVLLGISYLFILATVINNLVRIIGGLFS